MGQIVLPPSVQDEALVVTARSQLRNVLFLALSVCGFLCVYKMSGGTAERICAKFTRKTCLIPHLDEFEGENHRSRSQGTKTAFFGPFGGLRAVFVW